MEFRFIAKLDIVTKEFLSGLEELKDEITSMSMSAKEKKIQEDLREIRDFSLSPNRKKVKRREWFEREFKDESIQHHRSVFESCFAD